MTNTKLNPKTISDRLVVEPKEKPQEGTVLAIAPGESIKVVNVSGWIFVMAVLCCLHGMRR